jgi:hypothetical protein
MGSFPGRSTKSLKLLRRLVIVLSVYCTSSEMSQSQFLPRSQTWLQKTSQNNIDSYNQ